MFTCISCVAVFCSDYVRLLSTKGKHRRENHCHYSMSEHNHKYSRSSVPGFKMIVWIDFEHEASSHCL